MANDDKDYRELYRAWEDAKFAPPPEKPLCPAKPSVVEMVPMRDGVRLYTEIYRSCQAESSPVVLVRSPYPFSKPSRNDRLPISRYQNAGYTFIFQLTRGQGLSEGVYRYYIDDIDDGYDCIEWIANQSWCNGSVGMQGPSYLGNTQLLAAKAKPPALKCIMPTAFVGNGTQYFPFSYGVPSKGPYMQWFQVLDAQRWDDVDVAYCDMNALDHPKWGPAFRKRPLVDAANEILSGDKLNCWRETISHPMDNEFWESIHFTDRDLSEFDLPAFFTDGWYDTTIGPIDFFTRLERLQPGRSDRYLLVGPWDHYQTSSHSRPREDNGDRILPANAAVNHVDYRLAFFDRYLKGNQSSEVQVDRVRVYITGVPDSNANRWLDMATYPAPTLKHKRLYLHSQGDARSFPGNGILNTELPGDEPIDSYWYDPDLPTAYMARSARDRRDIEIRSDVLTYTSEPFKEPLTILGDMVLTLYAASDGLDTDWFTVVTEVFPDGQSKSFHYAPPAFRARYRQGLKKEELLKPHKAEKYCLPLGAAGHQIGIGNRLRLSIFSAAFPEYDPNTNTGNPAATDTEMRIAKQTIFHNAQMASYLVLPIIELGTATK